MLVFCKIKINFYKTANKKQKQINNNELSKNNRILSVQLCAQLYPQPDSRLTIKQQSH